MPTLEERVAYLEGRLGDHVTAVDDLRVTYREFRSDMNRQFEEMKSDVRQLEDHVHQQFRWFVGIQVTSLVAVGSAVVGLYFR